MLSFFKKRKIIIAIDGHSSCGKSTLARDVARRLKYIYVDSGAMYRAVTLRFIWDKVNINDHDQVKEALDKIDIRFKTKRRKNLCYLNGELVVVFPMAELKIFVTADLEIRTHRRYLELKNRGREIPFDKVKENLIKRDRIDSTREDSPLKQAEDAIVLDNSQLSTKEQLNAVLKLTKMHL